MNENKIRPWIYVLVTLLHFILILFIVFDSKIEILKGPENARVIHLIDLDEFIPPPPVVLPRPPPPPQTENDDDIPRVEDIAEFMIETDTPPLQTVVPAGTLNYPSADATGIIAHHDDDYLPMHLVSSPPQFDVNLITAALVYPPIALRSNIEGRVILELFVDRTGTVQRVIILREEPEDRGFGEAAVRAFTGMKGTPAMANGEPVSSRYRYPLRFTLK